MSDEVLIEIDGIEDVCRLFETAPKSSVPQALLHGLQAGGAVIQAAIAARVPDKTGALKANLDTTVTLDEDGMGGVAEIGFDGKEAEVARWLEYGHREVGHEPRKRFEGLAGPHPFMRPAAEAANEEALDACENKILEELSNAGLVDR